VPALRWVDVAGDAGGNPAGIIVANDSTYGYIVDGSGVTAHLLRSSYDPDPLPEAGKRTFGFVLEPYSGRRECWRAVRAAEALNQPLAVVNAGITEGELEARCGLLENLTPAVLVTCVKRAEDGGGLIIRLVEVEGEPALARVRLAPELGCGAASALETDLMERPKPESSAKLCDGVLEVRLPAFGLATVRVG
jgi:alpha-mannosidase